jgi:ribosomal protein L18E
MSQKAERPTLQGQRFRTRKRDEKEKFNPTGFRDTILSTFDAFDIDSVIKCLLSDTKIDYRVYGEQLFDIIIAGGILAPGGSILTDSDPSKQYRTDVCLFKAVEADDLATIKNFANIFVRLIQRFGYLEKTLEEEFKKIIVFLKGFEPDDRIKLAKITGVLLSLGILPSHVLLSALQEHLVKDGYALDFLIQVLQTWINEKDPATVWNSMRRSGVDNKLLEFLSPNKRSSEILIQTFQNNGLQSLVTFLRTKESEAKKAELQKKIATHIKNKTGSKEIVELIKGSNQKNNLEESEVIVLIWKTLMSIVEWNKKEELVAEQAMRHLKTYAPLMEAFTKSAKAQLALIIRIQEYCYDNMNFLKAFHRIIVLLYKADVLTEDIILEWYKRGHSNKGKSVFLEQIKPFIEWLTNAEEESEGE